MYDRDTGKPKGFGFCEYVDEESARCAMRNLNHTEFGGRLLRVDYSDKDDKAPEAPGTLTRCRPCPHTPSGERTFIAACAWSMQRVGKGGRCDMLRLSGGGVQHHTAAISNIKGRGLALVAADPERQ